MQIKVWILFYLKRGSSTVGSTPHQTNPMQLQGRTTQLQGNTTQLQGSNTQLQGSNTQLQGSTTHLQGSSPNQSRESIHNQGRVSPRILRLNYIFWICHNIVKNVWTFSENEEDIIVWFFFPLSYICTLYSRQLRRHLHKINNIKQISRYFLVE